jgi:hypothetical protein
MPWDFPENRIESIKFLDFLEKDSVTHHSPDPTVCRPTAKSKVSQCVSAGKIYPPSSQ